MRGCENSLELLQKYVDEPFRIIFDRQNMKVIIDTRQMNTRVKVFIKYLWSFVGIVWFILTFIFIISHWFSQGIGLSDLGLLFLPTFVLPLMTISIMLIEDHMFIFNEHVIISKGLLEAPMMRVNIDLKDSVDFPLEGMERMEINPANLLAQDGGVRSHHTDWAVNASIAEMNMKTVVVFEGGNKLNPHKSQESKKHATTMRALIYKVIKAINSGQIDWKNVSDIAPHYSRPFFTAVTLFRMIVFFVCYVSFSFILSIFVFIFVMILGANVNGRGLWHY